MSQLYSLLTFDSIRPDISQIAMNFKQDYFDILAESFIMAMEVDDSSSRLRFLSHLFLSVCRSWKARSKHAHIISLHQLNQADRFVSKIAKHSTKILETGTTGQKLVFLFNIF